MNHPESRWQLDAYVDGELELAAQLAMEERLAGDPELRSRVQGMQRLREALRGQADYHEAPPELRARVQALVVPKPRPWPRPERGRHPLRWWAGAAIAVAAAALAVNLALLPLQAGQRIEDDVVASHVRATLGARSVDVASSEHHVLKPWLSSRLDFSPDVPEPQAGRGTLLGGRVDYVDGRPVAVLVWRAGPHVADDFTWPSATADHPPVMTSSRGFNVAHWTRHRMAHWLISDLNREELAQLARQMAAD
ncbi:anti-sigma factor family protein [Ramlibacter humi]|uniref:Anti-sigma factor n=1 Tax=Ramlibacter humi TaxID=2530451 RepID=A0A4Z0BMR2_9BURK|nr:anti-sigma factor [Ramlibacter humi]TFZ00062.1 anti-sigma factor [Ramlibacter humi]